MLSGIVKTLPNPWFRHYLSAWDLCHHPGVLLHHWPAIPSGKTWPCPWHLIASAACCVGFLWAQRKVGTSVSWALVTRVLQSCLFKMCSLVWQRSVGNQLLFSKRKQRFLIGEQGPLEITAKCASQSTENLYPHDYCVFFLVLLCLFVLF